MNMSESEKPEGDFADSDAVRTGEDGEPRAVMESLQKSGGDEEEIEVLEKSED
mgnify:CR=1 FL=1